MARWCAWDSDAGVCLALSPLPQSQLLYYGCEIAEAHMSWRWCGPAPLALPLNVLSHPLPVLLPLSVSSGMSVQKADITKIRPGMVVWQLLLVRNYLQVIILQLFLLSISTSHKRGFARISPPLPLLCQSFLCLGMAELSWHWPDPSLALLSSSKSPNSNFPTLLKDLSWCWSQFVEIL